MTQGQRNFKEAQRKIFLYERIQTKFPKMSRIFLFRFSIPISMVMVSYFCFNYSDYYQPYDTYGNVYDVKGYPDYANEAVIFYCKDKEEAELQQLT